jgi:hypothetical protein
MQCKVQLEVFKTYVARNGKLVRIITKDIATPLFKGDDERWRNKAGYHTLHKGRPKTASPFDLVCEYLGPVDE